MALYAEGRDVFTADLLQAARLGAAFLSRACGGAEAAAAGPRSHAA
jgi:hypothetical protein